MNKPLTYLNNNELFEPIDRHFAEHILEISNIHDADIYLAAALVSWSTRNGNVCLDLNKIDSDPTVNTAVRDKSIVLPKVNEWIDKLSKCMAIGIPGDHTPLIRDSKNRLYFYRYWEYEKTIADAINHRIQSPVETIDDCLLREGINRIFDTDDTADIDAQKTACFSAVHNRFCVVSGGPGTGKTTTVAKILTLLVEQAVDNDINIILCAPTGKAAASLSETIRSVKAVIPCDDTVRNRIPDEASTIHRLLKKIPGSPYFKYNKTNPLPADVVIVDEASMVDVALMAKLFSAIPAETRIILIGDKDQLSSVEAGSALGDICNREIVHDLPSESIQWMQHVLSSTTRHHPVKQEPKHRMIDHVIVLDKNYRFGKHSGIGGLSKAVNEGDSNTSLQILTDPEDNGVHFLDVSDPKTLYQALGQIMFEGYSQYLSATDPYSALNIFNQFKILCALKTGPFGGDTINLHVQNILHGNKLIFFDAYEPDPMYNGRPVIITRNDYTLGLFNGDTGIIMNDPDKKNNALAVFFPKGKNELKYVPLHRLPEHETAYTMTVHKSQGAEFNDVLIILPDKYYPILTRELIYTGITRAINSVTIWGKKDVLKRAIENRIERTSGLRDALWN